MLDDERVDLLDEREKRDVEGVGVRWGGEFPEAGWRKACGEG